MARTTPIINAFVTGEISPYLLGRTDLAKYPQACEFLANFIPKVQGGVVRRPGLRFIAETLLGPGRLIPFTVDVNHSYVLLFTNNKIQFFTNDGQIKVGGNPYYIDSPYSLADDLEKIKFVQIADVMYLVHPKHPIQKLNHVSDTHWVLNQPRFDAPPTVQEDEDISGGTIGIDHFASMVPVPNAKGTAFIILPAGSGGYPPGYLPGQTITAGTGVAIITAELGRLRPDVTAVSITITSNFDGSEYGPGTWTLAGITTTVESLTLSTGPPFSAAGDRSVVMTAPVFIAGDVGREIVAGTGVGIIEAVVGATATDPITGATLYQTANITTLDTFDAVAYGIGFWFLRGSPNSYFSAGAWDGGSSYWTASHKFSETSIIPIKATTGHPTDSSFEESTGTSYARVQYTGGFTETFRASDLGKFVVFDGGMGRITKIIDSKSIEIKILSTLTVTESDALGGPIIAPASPGSWYYELQAFSADKGFPAAIAFFQDRLWLAGSSNNPQSVWASVTSDYENFAKGILDTAGLQATIGGGNFDTILWLQAYMGNIIVGTFRGEFVLGAGSGVSGLGQNTQAITPTNVSITFQSTYGVTGIQPTVIQEMLMYVQRSQQNAYEMSFNIQNALYTSKDLNILNDLIAETPMIEMVYQQNPYKVVWFLLADPTLVVGQKVGQNLIGLTYDKSQDVFAWHRHFSGKNNSDSFLSMACIPVLKNNTLVDEMWFFMKRIVGNTFHYSIEVMDPALYVDFATHTVQGPVSSVYGLTYLQGEDIVVVGDGALLPPVLALAGDAYDLPPGFTAFDIQVGLNFTSKLITVRPEFHSGGGTAQGIIKRWNKIWVRVFNSLGIEINGQFMANRTPQDLMTQSVPLFTGDEAVINLSYDRDGRVSIQQQNPLPANILAIFGQLLIGEN